MKLYQRWIHMRRRIRREAKRALKKHGNVRDAAASLGMPRSTFHEWVTGRVRV